MCFSRSLRRLRALAHADHIQPVVVRALVVGHLIHDVEGVAAVVIDGLKEADRVLNRLQGKDHVLAGQLQFLGKLGYIGLAAMRSARRSRALSAL